ncbi:MAG: type VI secretion system protein TssA [Variovorax sp.]
MLSPELVEALRAPISEDSPCGGDLEYDADFMALASAAEGKPEQQFGDNVIPAVEPEWRSVSDQAQALLRRSKDVRVAVLMLRAATHLQGVPGFSLGLQLLTALLTEYWEAIHPQLDAEDNNDPTMRLNSLAPLAESPTGAEGMVQRDLYDATIGTAPGTGSIRVRDVAVAHNALTPSSDTTMSQAQVRGALEQIQGVAPERIQALQGLGAQLKAIETLVAERSGEAGLLDLGRLRSFASTLRQACTGLGGAPQEGAVDGASDADAGAQSARSSTAATRPGEISTRQDAQHQLDRVIAYLEQAEPGNPAPLLIKRAKGLIGVSFIEIMNDLAPDALEAIRNVTGRDAAVTG